MRQSLRFAFAGFRHGHIFDLYSRAQAHAGIEVTSAAEDNQAARTDAVQRGIAFSHDSVDELLDAANYDVLAVGDCYSRRGGLVLRALEAGKHVISDKPFCTTLNEHRQIVEAAGRNRRRLGCMLDLRALGRFHTLRRLILEGWIGQVHTLQIEGQHPLLPRQRPGWYFESGRHGGTINDIAIHLFDLVPWLTGRKWHRVVAARTWNAKAGNVSHFQDAAQLMLELDNGAGVLADVSYLAPDRTGYSNPQYWRVQARGQDGFVETAGATDFVAGAQDADEALVSFPVDEATNGQYLEDFLADCAGEPRTDGLTTESILEIGRQALVAQRAADKREFDIAF